MNRDLLLKKTLMFFYDFSRIRALKRKSRKILSIAGMSASMGNPPADIFKKYKNLWNILPAKADTTWLKMYSGISGISDYRYVPETIYYNRIEPCLNNKSFSKAYTDKNFYPVFLAEFKIPETLVKNTEGVFCTNNNTPVTAEEALGILAFEKSVIIKPAVDSGGGRKVTLWKRDNGKFISNEGSVLSWEYLFSVYRKNFIIQTFIEQHPFYSSFNPGSLNTIRILTYRSVKDESINILHSILRVGAAGSITDNQASGGYACGIDSNGALTGKAVDKWGRCHKAANGIPIPTGIKIEGFEKMKKTAISVGAKYNYSRLLGLDLCIDIKGDVRLIEVNNINNEINFFQMLYGPLFGDFTEEVVIWCSGNKRSFMIDFEI